MEVPIIETKLNNAVNLGKTSIKGQILLNIRELSFHRTSIIVINVGKLCMKAQILLYIIVSLLKRRLKNVVSAANRLTVFKIHWTAGIS